MFQRKNNTYTSQKYNARVKKLIQKALLNYELSYCSYMDTVIINMQTTTNQKYILKTLFATW